MQWFGYRSASLSTRFGTFGKRRRKPPHKAKSLRALRHLAAEPLEERCMLSIFGVNTTDDTPDVLPGDGLAQDASGNTSLRAAMEEANALAGADTINFSIGSGLQTIQLLSPLPAITDPVTLDGTTQPGFVGTPIVQIDGTNAGYVVLDIVGSGSGSTLQALAITNAPNVALRLSGSSNNLISNVDASWTGEGKSGTGISLESCSNNTIERVSARNRDQGLHLRQSSGTLAQDNDFSGAGSWGIHGYAEYTPGGNRYLRNNVSHSGNGLWIEYDQGVEVTGGDLAGIAGAALWLLRVTDSHVWGLDASWTGEGKLGTGISLAWCTNNTIEQVTGTNRNIGLQLTTTSGTVVEHNAFSGAGSWGIYAEARGTPEGNQYLDNDVSGSANGVVLINEVGMTVSKDSFAMSDVPGTAIRLVGVSDSHVSGLDASWTGEGKPGIGITLEGCSHNTIERVSARNRDQGLYLWRSSGTLAQDNDFSGAGSWGIHGFADGAPGGNRYLRNNVSNSGNGLWIEYDQGVDVTGGDLSGIAGAALWLLRVTDSHVWGLDASWTGEGKVGTGISLTWCSNNTIEQVTVSNRQTGLALSRDGVGNRIRRNTIFDNVRPGIDLGDDGVTLNDPGDTDTGPNNLQNFPVLTAAEPGTATRVQGTLNSVADTTFTLDFYANATADPSGYGEGQRWLGSTTVTTDPLGDATFDVLLTGATTAGQWVTATATAPDGSTSEFSAGVLIVNAAPVAADDAVPMYGQSVTIAASDLLANDSDPEGDPIAFVLVDAPGEGTLTDNGDGTYTYAVGPGFDGLDTFTYRASDGTNLSNLATVTITHMLYVRNTNDSGDGSLRWTIDNANSHPGLDTIQFAIPGAGVHTIQPLSALPGITDPVVIDGYSQPGASPNALPIGNNAVLKIELSGEIADDYVNGLTITAGNSTVRGLVINRFHLGSGVLLVGIGGNIIQGSFIGTDASGIAALPNNLGINVENAPNNTIGGTDPGARNVISGNSFCGVLLDGSGATGNVIAGNYIGTDLTGTVPLSNRIWVEMSNYYGIYVYNAPNNIIGGRDPGARNVISRNQGGVLLDGSGATRNVIAGNYIGTDASGTAALWNAEGITVLDAPNNTIGGTDPSARNVISANWSAGIRLSASGATGNVIAGNFVGTDASGTAPIGNQCGISVYNAPNNTIGGTDPGARNVISGNSGPGVMLEGSGATGNMIVGNYVGTDLTGTVRLSDLFGIYLRNAPNNTIGGTDPGARNVISGNSGGVLLHGPGASGNVIAGNFIGTDASGTAAIYNGYGFWIEGPNNIIGGTDPGARNVISGNFYFGVWLNESGATGNVIAGNYIGTDASGTAAVPNNVGIYLYNAPDNTIGGTLPGQANTIAWNVGPGVLVSGSAAIGNAVRRNSIFNNGGLGIDLGGDGATPNDPGDADAGPNDFQNFPVLMAAEAGIETRVQGTLNSAADTTFTLDFYANTTADPSGYGEGQRWLGSATVTTNSLGNGSFDVLLTGATTAGQWVTATATGPDGSTSEFSLAVEITYTPPASLQGLVWEDFNDNGLVDLGETAVEGVVITITGTDDLGNPVLLTQTTDAQGIYEFADLRPGTYAIKETQPSGFVDGREVLGEVLPTGTNGVIDPAEGDKFSGIVLVAGSAGVNYNFGERVDGGQVAAGQTANVGFWQNKHGQALIRALNGGETSTVLGHWLADTFPNMYGGLEGATNAGIAATYQVLFKRTAKTSPGGPPKLDAQVMAVALATFVTKESLVSLRYVSPGEDPITDPALVALVESYGFVVTAGGVGSASFNVGDSGAAFNLADHTSAQIIDLLLATDGLSRDGLLYDDDAHGQAGHGEIDAFEALLRRLANDVYAAISQQGSI